MANSRNKPSFEGLPARLAERLLPSGVSDLSEAGLDCCVALSGGLDSTVLLHLLCRLRAQGAPLRLSAVHVNHGLSPRAGDWQRSIEQLCRAWEVPLQCAVVQVSRQSGLGLEGAARVARYRVLDGVVADRILLAHHQDDQAETLLLNLLRGASVHGAAAMRQQDGRYWRPLLEESRETLRAWAGAHDLCWVEDESNGDPAFSRNFLRLEVLPLLRQRFPAAAARLAAASAGFSDAAAVLDEVAAADGGGFSRSSPLEIGRLLGLSVARQANLLAAYLRVCGLQVPSRGWLVELLRQLREAAPDRQVQARTGDWVVQRFAGRVYCRSVDLVGGAGASLALKQAWADQASVSWGAGRICQHRRLGQGLSPLRLTVGQAYWMPRSAVSSRFRLRVSGPSRSLKDYLREAAWPPWQRGELPILLIGDRPCWVPGVGYDEAYGASAGEVGICFTYDPF